MTALTSARRVDVMALLHQHVPLALLVDLVLLDPWAVDGCGGVPDPDVPSRRRPDREVRAGRRAR